MRMLHYDVGPVRCSSLKKKQKKKTKMNKNEWVTIVKCENWGHYFYVKKGDKQNPEKGLDFKKGSRVDVMLPDGTELFTKIEDKCVVNNIPDMWHSYDVETHLYGVRIDAHGLKLFVPIEKVKLRTGSVPGIIVLDPPKRSRYVFK